jgi:hypothetical protein
MFYYKHITINMVKISEINARLEVFIDVTTDNIQRDDSSIQTRDAVAAGEELKVIYTNHKIVIYEQWLIVCSGIRVLACHVVSTGDELPKFRRS